MFLDCNEKRDGWIVWNERKEKKKRKCANKCVNSNTEIWEKLSSSSSNSCSSSSSNSCSSSSSNSDNTTNKGNDNNKCIGEIKKK